MIQENTSIRPQNCDTQYCDNCVLTPSIFAPLKAFDESRDIWKISTMVMDIMQQHDWITFSMVERSFREYGCFSYVVAREESRAIPSFSKFFLRDETKKYGFHLTTLDKEGAMEYVCGESASYEENFEKLSDTGFTIIDQPVKEVKKQAGPWKIWTPDDGQFVDWSEIRKKEEFIQQLFYQLFSDKNSE